MMLAFKTRDHFLKKFKKKKKMECFGDMPSSVILKRQQQTQETCLKKHIIKEGNDTNLTS